MKQKSFFLVSVLSVSILIVVGCGTIRLYEGSPRPQNEVALIRGMYFAWKVIPTAVDGKPVGYAAWIEVPPGRHTVDVAYSRYGGPAPGQPEADIAYHAEGQLVFVAEAGHKYEVDAKETLQRDTSFGIEYRRRVVYFQMRDITHKR